MVKSLTQSQENLSQHDSDKLLRIRHTCAHIMAMAVKKVFPGTKVATGPVTENGFYYDFDCPVSITPDDLSKIEDQMRRIIKANLPIIREEVQREEIRTEIAQLNESYKLEILDRIPEGETITRYFIGSPDTGKPESSLFITDIQPASNYWWDLCAGPHINFTGEIEPDAFKLLNIAGAYWQGDETKAQLQRIYGIAWETKEQLQAYLKQREEALRRDHRKLGQELNLFSIQEDAGGGLVFWHPKGAIIRYIIEDYWRKSHLESGYQLLYTPHIANLDLWKTSGHFDFYQENMFDSMDVENQAYQIKPMNCPFHVLTYKHQLHSYRELPLRWAELGTVYRYERSGALHGLMRVRGFTQDDAHVFCLPNQIADEILGVLNLTEQILSDFGFKNYEVNLSTRPEKSVGNDEVWELATSALRQALNTKGWNYIVDEGGGAFYGPKIDIKIQDAIGRLWQCSTIQVDFNLPERFDMEYIAVDGSRQRPIMIHRAIFGSLERFFGILIENYSGDFPLWLAPVQLRLLPVSDEVREYAQLVVISLKKAGIRVETDSSGERLGKQIRTAELEKIPVVAVVGKKEVENQNLSVRTRQSGDLGVLNMDEILHRLQDAINSKSVL
ncbi:threonyl-tRNA synthetase / Ser-tRNA(Thr) hydrolase (plasmid) [Trichormus variabilis ATCC 29413]|uniref:Threonine--tRNA ligase n=2 Tax=Anabaena variabilis TaxID=264691 RepID=Q3M248_TRIV2|nr:MULTISPECIES: threonine--tRNA ligase [Nostocaceae]ABA24938.1 threonyl-tRNA synthetase / Ser-tRNA(Thr) hydrolase [Trichormus variabilis ATCC 29413]MBC1217836.1 threonine--tRNA ligase [Trichormus variabilis ARAD]MBC1259052.1 threonine--tRNA ligase [Trichormus variabilis V5]MBC1305624.1 threonine--tRNA ligase [Trichormus variabilis N2B]MBC1314532.1 threonine--tRNA ligase [Trichormus variabilis PNB]